MLHIIGSMKTLKGEAKSAKKLCKDIIGVLQLVTPDTNLTKEVGIFAIQMPDYKVLSKDADMAKNILRKVCTGEITAKDALKDFNSALHQLETLLKMFDAVDFH